jgi:hypothetical protein
MNQAHGRLAVIASLLLPALAILGGCQHEVVPTSGPHAPVAADQVKIYNTYPAKYEVLGKLELPITEKNAWDARGEANAAFDAMKAKAGAIGATGILLQIDPANYDYMATAGYHKTFYQVPMRSSPRTAMADAIYVIKE